MVDIGRQIEDLNWQQGSILKEADAAALRNQLRAKWTDNSVVIVVSQSCDLVHHDLEAEPFAEIIVGQSVAGVNGNLTDGKNPRRLHLRIESLGSADLVVEIVPSERYYIGRQQFVKIKPDEQRFLIERERRTLASWLAGRYKREALPTTFNQRIVKTQKKRDKIHRRLSERVSALLVKLMPNRELPDNEPYHVRLLALVPADDHDPRDALENDLQALATQISQDGSIFVDQMRVVSETEISVALYRQFSLFPLEYLSVREDPPHPLPPLIS